MEITMNDSLKKRFWKYGNLVTGNEFKIDEENKQQIQTIIDTLENSYKGIVVCGRPGSGKTFIFEILSKIYREPFNPERIVLKNCDSIVSDYEKFGDDVFKKITQRNICFDELGREKSPAKYYGSECDVFQKIIQNRYNDFKLKGSRTFFTSNYSKNDIRERYGEHCFSRLNEMTVFVNLGTELRYSDRRVNARPFIGGLPEVLTPFREIDPNEKNYVPPPPEFLESLNEIANKFKTI